jgi:LysM repeat protein
MIRLISLIKEEVASADSIQWATQFQRDLGLTPEAAAAMAANIQHESGFIADRIQGAGIKRGPMAASGNLGYSWALWTFGPRKQAFRDYVLNTFDVDINKTPANNKHAYSFLKQEIKNYPGFDFDSFKTSTDVDAATEQFVTSYEQAGKPMLAQRQQIAKEILNNIKTTPAPTQKSDTWKSAVKTGVDMATSIGKSGIYTVKPGDTLSDIAVKYKTTVDSLKQLNQLNSDTIQIGQKLKLK